MNAPTPAARIEAVILDIPDVATALGEIRCLTQFAHPRLLDRVRNTGVDMTDIAAMAVLSIVSRIGLDSSAPVNGPLEIGACGCGGKPPTSVMATLAACAAESVAGSAPPLGTGQYL